MYMYTYILCIYIHVYIHIHIYKYTHVIIICCGITLERYYTCHLKITLPGLITACCIVDNMFQRCNKYNIMLAPMFRR